MKADLGTYHLKVEFHNARGYIARWNTGARFCRGNETISPIDADVIPPIYEDEETLLECMVYSYTEGNYSCDCNRALMIAWAYQEDEPKDQPCTEDIKLKRLTVMRPDGSEKVLFEKEKE